MLRRPFCRGFTALGLAVNLSTSAFAEAPAVTPSGTPSPVPSASPSPTATATPAAATPSTAATSGRTPSSDPYRGLWDQETSFLFVRPEFTWGRDPFLKKPGYAPNAFQEPTYTLTAVFFDDLASEAIVNGVRVRVGEEISGRTVEEIGPNYVLLAREDSVLELNLPTNSDGGSSIRLEEIEKPAEGKGR